MCTWHEKEGIIHYVTLRYGTCKINTDAPCEFAAEHLRDLAGAKFEKLSFAFVEELCTV